MMALMEPTKRTLYEILGVGRDALPVDIPLAYERRSAELAAAVPHDPSALALLHEAHEVLSNPQRRAEYDAALVTAAERAAARAQSQAPDLLVEAETEPRKWRVPPVGIGIAIVAVLVLVYTAWHLRRSADAKRLPVEPVAETPKPVTVAPPPPVPQPRTAPQILAQAAASVGRLQSFDMSGRAVPVGLAIAAQPGAMVTTCHGIPANAQLVVTVPDGNHSATLELTDEVLDLCRLTVAASGAPALALAPEGAKAGDRIYALGANAAGELALTEGTVKALLPDARGSVMQLSMPVAANGSGGPVFDAFGRVVGIATTTQGHGPGVSVALPASWIAAMRSQARAR